MKRVNNLKLIFLMRKKMNKTTIYDCCVIELPTIHYLPGIIIPIDAGINLTCNTTIRERIIFKYKREV